MKKEKGYRLKPKNFRSWSKPIRVLSDVPVLRNWYKTVSKLFKNLRFSISFKQNIFSNQSETEDILEETENLRFASIIIRIYQFFQF